MATIIIFTLELKFFKLLNFQILQMCIYLSKVNCISLHLMVAVP